MALQEIQDDSGPDDDGVVSAAGTLGRFLPAFQDLVNRLDPILRPLRRRQMVKHVALQAITDTHFQLFETIQHVKLR